MQKYKNTPRTWDTDKYKKRQHKFSQKIYTEKYAHTNRNINKKKPTIKHKQKHPQTHKYIYIYTHIFIYKHLDIYT